MGLGASAGAGVRGEATSDVLAKTVEKGKQIYSEGKNALNKVGNFVTGVENKVHDLINILRSPKPSL